MKILFRIRERLVEYLIDEIEKNLAKNLSSEISKFSMRGFSFRFMLIRTTKFQRRFVNVANFQCDREIRTAPSPKDFNNALQYSGWRVGKD